MPQGVGVQVPPLAPTVSGLIVESRNPEPTASAPRTVQSPGFEPISGASHKPTLHVRGSGRDRSSLLPLLVVRSLAIPLVVMLAALVVLIWQLRRNTADNQWAIHSEQVLVTAQRALTQIVTAQSSARGFFLFHNDDLLNQANQAYAGFERDVMTLQNLVSDNPGQIQGTAKLLETGRVWKKSFDRTVSNYQKHPDLPVQQLPFGTAMSVVRSQFEDFFDAEVEIRSERVQRSIQSNRSLLIGTVVIAPLLGLLLGLLAVRELQASSAIYRSSLEEAERANRAKDEFLGMISHELRNPLNAITLTAYGLQRGPHTEERMQRGLASIDRSSKLLSDMVDDLVDSTRIASGRLKLDLKPMDLVLAVRSAFEMMRPMAANKHLDFTARFDVTTAPVKGDLRRLTESFTNVLDNAIKFTPAGGRIELSLAAADHRASVRVSDSGEGIDPAIIDHVFDRFVQGKASVERKGGLGLGLSIVKHIVELHGGKIDANSDGKGRGASFTISLPLMETASKDQTERNTGT